MNRKLRNEELGRHFPEEYKAVSKLPIVIVLDDIRSLANVGSVFRTADAFLVSEVILCGITGRPPHRDIHKAALGATETVCWSYEASAESAVETLKSGGYSIVAIEQCEQSYEPGIIEALNYDKVALVFGNEVDGVRQAVVDRADAVMEIPQAGTKHSLNVAVAAGIVIWEWFKYYSR